MQALRLEQVTWLRRLRLFFASPWGVAAQAALAVPVIVFKLQIAGLVVFILLFSALMALCDKLLTSAVPFLLLCLFLVQSNPDGAFDRYVPFWWLVFFPAGAIIFHVVVYRTKFVRGRAFWAILAVSVAITLGGAGVISGKEYFAGTAIFHVLALGFGQLLAYVWLCGAVAEDTDGTLPRFVANMMVCVGLLACFMILHVYLVNIPSLIHKPQVLAFQWRNNVSTFLMLALPFAFYKAGKRPLWLLAAAMMLGSLWLSGSRGGMIFGSVEFVLCMLFLFFSDKKRRLLYISVAALCAALLVVAIPKLFAFFWPTIQRLLETLFKQEARILLYRRAVEDFLAHPFFGTGIGYMGNRDVHPSREFALCWYHCAPLQIIGSLGCVGVAAYLYQYVTRVRVFLRSRTNFHWTLLLSWLALEMMSLVNPGVFVPLPYLLLVTMFTVFAEKTPAPAADAVASP